MAEDFEPATLQRLFRDAVREDRLALEAAGSQRSLKVGIQQPLNLKKLYREFVDKGFDWPITTGHRFSLALQNSKSRERPESSHRLYLYYSARVVDRFLAGALAFSSAGSTIGCSLGP